MVGDLDEAWRWAESPGILPHRLGYRIDIQVLANYWPFCESDIAVPIARTEMAEGNPIRLSPGGVLRTNWSVPSRPNSNSVVVVAVYSCTPWL